MSACGPWTLAHPWLTFFMFVLLLLFLEMPFRLMNRWIRHRNIVQAGWPPPHLDGDGDFKTVESDE